MEKISEIKIMKTVLTLQQEIQVYNKRVREVVKRTKGLADLISKELDVSVICKRSHISFNLPITDAKVTISLSHDTMYLDIPAFNTSQRLSVSDDEYAAKMFYKYLEEYNLFLSELALTK